VSNVDERPESESEQLSKRFAELAGLSKGSARHTALRQELITDCQPIARHIARRFAHRGEPQEDLEQVAMLGMINAVDRFEPERGSDFLSFAVPTITGEIRRYFRDRAWSIQLPRRLKDLHLSIRSAAAELTQRHGRTPRPSEIAEHIGVPIDDVLDGLSAATAYRSDSLDRPLAEDSDATVKDMLGVGDTALDLVEDRESVKPLLAKLPERERTVLLLRFFRGMSQAGIADELGVSQMHVSRLLTQTLRKLRDGVQRGDSGS
jgi:RNA polymerase sigma-B factor